MDVVYLLQTKLLKKSSSHTEIRKVLISFLLKGLLLHFCKHQPQQFIVISFMYTNNSFYPGSYDVAEQGLCHTDTLLPFWQRKKASSYSSFLYFCCSRGLARQSTFAGVYWYFLTQIPKDVYFWYSWVFDALKNGFSDYTSVVTKCFLLFWI